MNDVNSTPLFAILSYLFLVLGGVIGYFVNIFKLIGFEGNTMELFLRIAGIFIAPLGSIMGLFVG